MTAYWVLSSCLCLHSINSSEGRNYSDFHLSPALTLSLSIVTVEIPILRDCGTVL